MNPQIGQTEDFRPLTIMWFRQDLRLRDNPALCAAAAGGRVLPVYVLDDGNAGEWKMGGASRWWLHHSLSRLNESLNGGLWVLRGEAERELAGLCASLPVRKVVWNRCYEPWRRERDGRIKRTLGEAGVEAASFNGALLLEPWENTKADGTPYRVFTPFYHSLLSSHQAVAPLPQPRDLAIADCSQPADRIGQLGLKPRIPWDAGLAERWMPGEAAALARWSNFLEDGAGAYQARRDFPADAAASSLSPHLHFGEISSRQIWWDIHSLAGGDGGHPFARQLCWREFAHHLMYHDPRITRENWRGEFDHFPWREDAESLRRWQQGSTGIPLVDAGMRELWATGTMHNRARMVTGSFLTKNLLIHWRRGADWFWDCLVDADLANNSFGWQWVAGSGADAAPYFRIFNPVLQSRKFDPQGAYLRRWLPALRDLPEKHIHAPWEAPESVLRAAGIRLGEDYPLPIVDLRMSRERALGAWQTLRRGL